MQSDNSQSISQHHHHNSHHHNNNSNNPSTHRDVHSNNNFRPHLVINLGEAVVLRVCSWVDTPMNPRMVKSLREVTLPKILGLLKALECSNDIFFAAMLYAELYVATCGILGEQIEYLLLVSTVVAAKFWVSIYLKTKNDIFLLYFFSFILIFLLFFFFFFISFSPLTPLKKGMVIVNKRILSLIPFHFLTLFFFFFFFSFFLV